MKEKSDESYSHSTKLHSFNDNEFDIVFSNSVIEHLYNYDNQRIMANEVQRIAKKYYIQCPNRYFIIDIIECLKGHMHFSGKSFSKVPLLSGNLSYYYLQFIANTIFGQRPEQLSVEAFIQLAKDIQNEL